MAKNFYIKLAWANVKRNRYTYLPYLIALTLISGVYLLVTGMIFSDSLSAVPNGETATSMFSFGVVVFSLFVVGFMVYINGFLINRRKREFGLYGVLGLEKKHVCRILLYENALVLFAGLLLGTVFALVFGRLLFMVLIKLINSVAAGSSFSIPSKAYVLTYGLFLGVFILNSLISIIRVRVTASMTLLNSERQGQKRIPLVWLWAIIGLALLGLAYYSAWTIEKPTTALGLFFILVIAVIIATYLLFNAGSAVLLSIMRKVKGYYYKPNNFVTVSGLRHRMSRNANGLATICILSTMLIVTLSGTLALYLGSTAQASSLYPYDMSIGFFALSEDGYDDPALAEPKQEFVSDLHALAEKHSLTLSSDPSKLQSELTNDDDYYSNDYVQDPDSIEIIGGIVCADASFRFDVEGRDDDVVAFIDEVYDKYIYITASDSILQLTYLDSWYEIRANNYAVYGGLFFLGAFFGVLFLAMTVLIIYFKQVTEGYEDRERFKIMQQIGMEEPLVKKTINRQILWVFFLPLFATLLHMVFASKIMSNMFALFQIYDWGLILACIGGACLLFVLLYLIVFRLTAKAYYRIIRWKI
ncbi:MAG: ABC transporter permease [Clostridia bacterium]|nr:ABC transporter permease [Clostridia bacterium]